MPPGLDCLILKLEPIPTLEYCLTFCGPFFEKPAAIFASVPYFLKVSLMNQQICFIRKEGRKGGREGGREGRGGMGEEERKQMHTSVTLSS